MLCVAMVQLRETHWSWMGEQKVAFSSQMRLICNFSRRMVGGLTLFCAMSVIWEQRNHTVETRLSC